MNALVSMHGIWLLVFSPLAAVIAWRYSGPKLRVAATWLLGIFGVALAGWFGYLSFVGAEFASSSYDRLMHALGVIVGSISVPIFQLILALAIVVSWPRRFQFLRQPLSDLTKSEDEDKGKGF